MRVKLIILFFLPVLAFCQDLPTLKSKIVNFYFDVPLKSSKYEVMKTVHLDDRFGDDFHYVEYSNCVLGNFTSHTFFNFPGDDPSFVVWFEKETKKSYQRKISFRYSPRDLNRCISQLKEIVDFFELYSYKSYRTTSKNGYNDESGEGYRFFSSKKTFAEDNSFLSVGFTFFDGSSVSMKSYYTLEMTLWEDDLH